MSRSVELEEFGLESEEQASLIEQGKGKTAVSKRIAPLQIASAANQRDFFNSISKQPVPPETAQTASRILHPGLLKWAILLIGLAVIVFLNIDQDSQEATLLEEMNMADTELCMDDPEFTIMVGEERSCASYVANVGRPAVLQNRCDREVGIKDENEFQILLKHFCRKSCGLCTVEDEAEDISQDEIDTEVKEIAEEIAEKREQDLEEEVREEIEAEQHDENESGEMTPEDDLGSRENDTSGLNSTDDSAAEIRASDPASDGPATEAGSDEEVADADDQEENQEADSEEETIDGAEENPPESSGSGEEEGPESDKDDVVDDSGSSDSDGNVKVSTDGDATLHKEEDADATDKQSGGQFTLERLAATRKAAHFLVEELEEYYNGKEQTNRMLNDAWTKSWASDSEEDLQRMEKLSDTMARALVTEEQNEFIIGTIGSSVAAGHDNCHYDSYENQLERTLGPVWQAAGMKLVTQNAGEGGGCGDSYDNQVYCVTQNVSPNVDLLHYSWTYFEAGSKDKAMSARESLVRWAQMMPKQPPVHVLNVSWKREGDPKKEEELADYYAIFGYNTFYMRTSHTLGGYPYEGREEDYIIYDYGHVGDGYHNVTRYGREETDADRKDSLGVVMRNWHPGPLGFELSADAFSYVYSKAILEALDMIEGAFSNGKDPQDTWSASKRKVVLKRSLPAPLHCDPLYCSVDQPPSCLNYEKPTFGYWGARLEDPNGSLNPHKGEHQNWELWTENNDWTYMVDKQDVAVYQDSDEKEKCRHLDACGGISAATKENGMAVFRLPKMEVGLIVICGCCGKDVGENMFLNNTSL